MISHEEVRSTVVSLLADNPLTPDGTHFANFTSLEWDVYLKKMSDCSTYGDHLTLMAAAKLYDVNLVIVSSLDNQFNRVISPGSTNDGSCPVQYDRPFLFLGHYGETGEGLVKEHYVSLKWRNVCDQREYIESVVRGSHLCTVDTVNVNQDWQSDSSCGNATVDTSNSSQV